jgi:ATP-dependent protease ClpP protease subunit
MYKTGDLARDIGTVLLGEDAVQCGLIDEVGGLKESLNMLHQLQNQDRGLKQ